MHGSSALRGRDPTKTFTVLVIDDDLNFASSVAESIRQDGSQVLIADSAATALHLSLQHDADAVLVAAALPDGGSYDMVTELRRNGLAERAAVILLTPTSMQALKAASVRGVDLVLSKPSNARTFSGLLQFVQRQWRRGELTSARPN
jgi:DNA-binding response OmpR family regulator